MKYVDMAPAQLREEYNQVSKTFSELKQKGLKLDMSRGKPGKEQLDAVSDILTVLSDPKDCILDGLDVRNYGELTGLACAKNYFAEILGCKPEGIIYSLETISRIAHLKPAAPDFVVMWDNAYCVHEFEGDYVPFPDMLSICREAGNPDMVFEYASTSKVTFHGAGISVMASSVDNIKYMCGLITYQSISQDKVNQLRHVRYLKDKVHTLELMKKHAAILRPKFHTVLDALDREIAPLGIASWKRPTGGYFVSVDTMDGLAKRTLSLCKEAGVVMTSAGATFPNGIDPRDRSIRVAPSLPPVAELEQAVHVFCVCLRLAALEKLLGRGV